MEEKEKREKKKKLNRITPCIFIQELLLVWETFFGTTPRMHADNTPHKMHACIILTECTLASLHNKAYVGITPRTYADVTPSETHTRTTLPECTLMSLHNKVYFGVTL